MITGSTKRLVDVWFLALVAWFAELADSAAAQTSGTLAAPVLMTAQEDHRRLMDHLHITALRPGADGRNPDAANAANYDKAKANPYPNLPDPLLLKNGKKSRFRT